MLRYKTIIIIVFLLMATLGQAQEHTRFLDIPLDWQADSLVQELRNRGLQQDDRYELSGRIASLDVWLTVCPSKDSSKVSRIVLSTRHQQGHSLRDDYKNLMKWMRHHYGAPDWESTVRSHAFARWYVGFDRDIVMISTATPSVEIWFYENHQRRHFDYYAILKYCERNPSETAPFLTAQECVTWHDSVERPVVRKTGKSRYVRKASTARRHKGKTRRRRR
ncbi:MAG: hypothetical protein IJS95_00975 [Prevotella sp.]|nr:hypothetical protein [Prevotella sp.]